MSYRLVFDAKAGFPNWPVAMLPLAFLVFGVLFFKNRRRAAGLFAGRPPSYTSAFAGVFLLFSVIFGIGVWVVMGRHYIEIRRALENGEPRSWIVVSGSAARADYFANIWSTGTTLMASLATGTGNFSMILSSAKMSGGVPAVS